VVAFLVIADRFADGLEVYGQLFGELMSIEMVCVREGEGLVYEYYFGDHLVFGSDMF
jgi:hypothetical protein